ncbi:MAG: hypothetical protein HZB38_13835 [Planctomycetes bacterium]|nr:hypothetical protein [Planctomycetota bacterium]
MNPAQSTLMSNAPAPLAGNQELSQRVRERTLRERKRRIWRNALVVLAVTAAMVYVSLTNRDQQAIRNELDIGARLAAGFQEMLDRDKYLPNRVPDLGPRFRVASGRFIVNPFYADLSRNIRPVAVMYSKAPVHLFCRPSGRVVVTFDGEKFGSRWLLEPDFNERRIELGLGAGAQ